MAYVGRLQYTISGLQHERRALIFVNHSYPAAVAVDHLKIDIMMVHVVGHRPTVRNPDVRRDESATPAIGDKVTVLHAGPAGAPFAVTGCLKLLVLLETDANTVTRQLGNAGRVSRVDQIQSKSGFSRVKIKGRLEVAAGQDDNYDFTA
jgi:hypothetical protein